MAKIVATVTIELTEVGLDNKDDAITTEDQARERILQAINDGEAMDVVDHNGNRVKEATPRHIVIEGATEFDPEPVDEDED